MVNDLQEEVFESMIDSQHATRRDVLKALGAAGTVSLAGCLGGNKDSGSGGISLAVNDREPLSEEELREVERNIEGVGHFEIVQDGANVAISKYHEHLGFYTNDSRTIFEPESGEIEVYDAGEQDGEQLYEVAAIATTAADGPYPDLSAYDRFGDGVWEDRVGSIFPSHVNQVGPFAENYDEDASYNVDTLYCIAEGSDGGRAAAKVEDEDLQELLDIAFDQSLNKKQMLRKQYQNLNIRH